MKMCKFSSVVMIFCLFVGTLSACAGKGNAPSLASLSASSSASPSIATSSSSLPPAPPTAEAQALYSRYMQRVRPSMDAFAEYSSSHSESPKFGLMRIEEKEVLCGGTPANLTRFATEKDKLLHFTLEWTQGNRQIISIFYPAEAQLSFCQQFVKTLAPGIPPGEGPASAYAFALYTFLRDDAKNTTYFALPQLGLVLPSKAGIPSFNDIAKLYETGNGKLPLSATYGLPEVDTSSIPLANYEEANRLYQSYTAQIEASISSFTTAKPQLESRSVNYTPQPATMTRVVEAAAGKHYYYIEVFAETRKGDELIYPVGDGLSYCQRAVSVYADWAWATNTRGDAQEYLLYTLVRDDKTKAVYQLIPELEVAIAFTDWEMENFAGYDLLFEQGRPME